MEETTNTVVGVAGSALDPRNQTSLFSPECSLVDVGRACRASCQGRMGRRKMAVPGRIESHGWKAFEEDIKSGPRLWCRMITKRQSVDIACYVNVTA